MFTVNSKFIMLTLPWASVGDLQSLGSSCWSCRRENSGGLTVLIILTAHTEGTKECACRGGKWGKKPQGEQGVTGVRLWKQQRVVWGCKCRD